MEKEEKSEKKKKRLRGEEKEREKVGSCLITYGVVIIQ